jgi:uncharacterized protein YabN with tetrapyrrole methylase and pyrophosphatase domain
MLMSKDLKKSIEQLVETIRFMRGPKGCPWDQAQTLASLQPFILEEACEVYEAMREHNAQHHCEELGDLLMQIVFQAEIRREQGHFDMVDVIERNIKKLRSRKPHLFGQGVEAHTIEDAQTLWQQAKAQEKQARPSLSVTEPLTWKQLYQATQGKLAPWPRLLLLWQWASTHKEHQDCLKQAKTTLDKLFLDRSKTEYRAFLGQLWLALLSYAQEQGLQPEDLCQQAIEWLDSSFAKEHVVACET